MDNKLDGLVQSVEQKYALYPFYATKLAEKYTENKRCPRKAPS